MLHRAVLLLLAAGACAPVVPDTDTDTDAVALDACGLVVGLDTPDRAHPGDVLDVSAIDGSSGRAVALEWRANGAVEGEGFDVVWTLPTDVAFDYAAPVMIDVFASAEGCATERHSAMVRVDWPERLRTLVLYNPSAVGSEDVARYYAAFREIPDERLCPVASAATATLAAADWPAWLSVAKQCIEDSGPQTTYVVPVWGVPYRVAGIIDNIAGSGKSTVSIDGLLVYWPDAAAMKAAIYSPLYQPGDSRTGVFQPYLPIGVFRSALAYPYVLVARIDGADADAAMALVDRTRAAEEAVAAGTLDGIVYVDGRMGDTPPATDDFGSYQGGEWNMWGTRNLFEDDGRYEVVWDGNGAEFGTEPAPLWCDDALYYAGWYSFGNYNDAFDWTVGAVGGHLDSCSACDIRGTRDWSAMALRRGITATFGAVSEPYVAGMPEYDQFFAYLLQGASFAEAGYESTIIGGWMMVWVGDPLYRPYAR